ncbi:IS256 family transposase, partial [Amycolatopsis lurida]
RSALSSASATRANEPVSYDLAVWHEPAEATETAPTHPRIAAFYRELTARYPELDSLPDDDDSSPWSVRLAEALQAEVDAYIARFRKELDERGRRLVVRNGYHQPREVLTSAGAVEVTVPRVNDKRTDPDTGERKRFSSAILPPWARKTPEDHRGAPVAVPARPVVRGLRARARPLPRQHQRSVRPVVTKLTEQWQAEQRTFAGRSLSDVDYVYLWADGIHVSLRLEEHKLCLLVMIGVRADGRKELVALADGYRESTESWADLLRDCARRGMHAPVLAVGDGALGFWGALREVFPGTREQRCWFHKIGNMLAALPKSAHPGAKKALAEIWNAEDKRHALDAVKAFDAAYGAKSPRPPRRSPMISTSCSRSTTTRPNTGSTCAPRTRSSPPSSP